MNYIEIEKYLLNKKNMKYFYDWFDIVRPILFSDEFKKRIYFKHHYKSVFYHSVLVSFSSYKLAKTLKCDYKTCAIAGLLHDFYPYPWQYSDEICKIDSVYTEHLNEKKKLLKKHGFTHAYEAYYNYHKFYPEFADKKIDDAIMKHMFPLNLKLPKYEESWIISICDKIVSTKEIMKIC